MAGLSSIVGARGHEKRGCRWRARINQTGVKINCKTLASRVPFPPPLPPSSLSISAALPSPSLSPSPPLLALSWLSCVTREPSHLPLCAPSPSPPTPSRASRSLVPRSFFVPARSCASCAKGVRECEERMCTRAVRSSEMEKQGDKLDRARSFVARRSEGQDRIG